MSDFRTPAGWMLVPIKPTQKMVNAAKEIDGRLSVWKWADGYVEMLKQAPKPPADLLPDAGKMVDSEQELRDEIARLRFDLENATESRKLAQQALYDARERFQKEVLQRTAEVSRLLKERQDCEPVAWMTRESERALARGGNGSRGTVPVHAERTAVSVIPLYAAPQKREPFSDAQIVRIHSALQHGPEDTPWSWDFKQGFRAAEKAHGIGGQS